ncbi:MAG TPA: hypothetical protein VMV60_07925 [Thermoanaerobaculia bacterium]|nr:hypothetical protein [Thermoanaerobaculia bacterium]
MLARIEAATFVVFLAAASSAAPQEPVEERFSERASSSVLLVYDGQRLEPGVERPLLAALEGAYADLVQDLGSAPPRKIEVVVYAERDWRLATQAPDWSGGLFDGKVRVPAQGLTGVTPRLLAVLKHEMTHAFVAVRTNGRAPVWLHEGLAQVEEGKTCVPYAAALLEGWRREKTFGLPALEGSFRRLPVAQVRSGYLVSLAAAEMLRDTRGPGAIGHLLDSLGEGTQLEQAMRETVRADYGRVESDLADWLESRAR